MKKLFYYFVFFCSSLLLLSSCDSEEKESINLPPEIITFEISLIDDSPSHLVGLVEYEVSDPEGDLLTIHFNERRDYLSSKKLTTNKGSFEIPLVRYFPYGLQLLVKDPKNPEVGAMLTFTL